MKIQVLKNFGLGGEDLAAGSVVTVNKTLFGDNEQSFRDAGLFVDYVEPEPEGEAPAKKTTKKGTEGGDPPAEDAGGTGSA